MSYASRDITNAYKSVFLKGLGTLLPSILTLWFLLASYQFFDSAIATPISDAIKTQLVTTETGNEIVFKVWDNLGFLRKGRPAAPPADATPAEAARHRLREAERLAAAEPQRRDDLRAELDLRFPRWVGFLLAAVAVFIAGFFITSFLGSSVGGLFSGWASRIPLVSTVYSGAKQMVDFFVSSDGSSAGFQSVVAVEFPRKGLWSIGFLTSDNITEIEAHAGAKVRGVYLGTPAAGQVILCTEDQIVGVDMTVDEALKFLMSGGVIGRDPDRAPRTPRLPWDAQPSERLPAGDPPGED